MSGKDYADGVMKKSAAFLMVSAFMAVFASISFAMERKGEVTIHFNLNAPEDSKKVKLWIPYPVSDENQTVYGIKVSGNFSESGVYREGENGNMALYAEWDGPAKERTLVYTFRVDRKEAVKKDFPKNGSSRKSVGKLMSLKQYNMASDKGKRAFQGARKSV